MTVKTFLIDLVDAQLPKGFGFPDLGVDNTVLFNAMVKAAIWDEDVIYDLRGWFNEHGYYYQGDSLLNQYFGLKTLLRAVMMHQDSHIPSRYSCLLSTELLDHRFAVINIQELT